jgi:hypothetical protein
MPPLKVLFGICLILLVSLVSATPTMSPLAPADVTNAVATFHATGGVAPCWFSWGYENNLYWTTPNQSVTGDFSDTQTGSPMLTGETYKVTACDSTGCDPTPETFVVPTANVTKATHYGTNMLTIMRSGFNITVAAQYVIAPYALMMSDNPPNISQSAASIIWGIFFTIIFVGYWIRGRGIMLPAILAIISGGLMIGVGAPMQVAPIFTAMGLPLLMIGLAGVFTSWFSNK